MKGCYCLIINLNEEKTIRIGKKLGKIEFKSGYYVYVGSAMNSLIARIERHLSNEKKMHWHVDYLLKRAEITEVIYTESERKVECELSQYISDKSEGIEDFGCSDCECESHLYYFENKKEAIKCIENAYESMNMKYEYY